ncbi:unnamed protein product, partial [Nesidiocoris tenuis]
LRSDFDRRGGNVPALFERMLETTRRLLQKLTKIKICVSEQERKHVNPGLESGQERVTRNVWWNRMEEVSCELLPRERYQKKRKKVG